METGLIIIWGVVSCILAVYFGIRELAQQAEIAQLKNKVNSDFDADLRWENDRANKYQLLETQLSNSQYEVVVLKEEHKKLLSDIICFRAELGLGPRLYDDSAMVHIPHWGLPTMPRPSPSVKPPRVGVM